MIICNFYSEIKSGISEREVSDILDIISRDLDKDGEVSVHLISDKRMVELNKKHRSIGRTTDVLSFSALEGETLVVEKNSDFGDIFISIPQIQRQARDLEISFREEFCRMLVHGVLHLLGYDHIKSRDAKKMFAIQEELVSKLKSYE